jgi:hypothetical protein
VLATSMSTVLAPGTVAATGRRAPLGLAHPISPRAMAPAMKQRPTDVRGRRSRTVCSALLGDFAGNAQFPQARSGSIPKGDSALEFGARAPPSCLDRRIRLPFPSGVLGQSSSGRRACRAWKSNTPCQRAAPWGPGPVSPEPKDDRGWREWRPGSMMMV